MNYTRLIVYLIAYVAFLLGITHLIKSISHYRNSRLQMKRHLDYFKKNSHVDKNLFNENIFILSSYNFSIDMYNKIRQLVLLIGFLAFFLGILLDRTVNMNLIIFPCIIYMLMDSKSLIGPVPTITSIMAKLIKSQFSNDVDREIYAIVTCIKGIALSSNNELVNPVSILESIITYTDKTKSVFQSMLDYWQVGEFEEGVAHFEKYLNTPYCKKFAGLLLKLDVLGTSELTYQLDILQNIYSEEQYTRESIRNDKLSSRIYVPVVLSALLVLFNYIYITVYLTSIGTLLVY